MNSNSLNTGKQHTLRERFKEATAEAILEAAEKVFSDKGLYAARMEEIASEAGVSVGTLYNHFKDRETLFQSLVDQRRKQMLARMDAVLDENRNQDFVTQLRAFLVALSEHQERHLTYLRVLMEAEQYRTAGVLPSHCSKQTLTLLRERVTKLIKLGQRAKVLRSGDPEFYGTLLLGMLRSLMIRRIEDGYLAAVSSSERAETVVRFFLQGAEA